MDSFGIYKIECTITGVVYIGSTSVSFKKRWRKHKQRLRHNYHENSYLQNAWNKYGEDKFIFEIAETIDNIDIVKERESYWLSLYFPKGRDYCFNLSDHTDGGNTVKDEKTRLKLSQSVKASYTPELRKLRSIQGKNRSGESAKRLKETTSTEKWKIANTVKNRELAKDSKWLQKMKDINEHRQVPVGTDRGEVFKSVTEAAIQTGAMRANIRACIKGKIKTSKGRKWFYINNLNNSKMKKIMISQPMAGKTEEEIVETRNRFLEFVKDNNYELVNTLFTDEWYSKEAMENRGVRNIPLQFLAKSIENMGLCDIAYFAKGWDKTRGCKIEHEVAKQYNMEVIYEK